MGEAQKHNTHHLTKEKSSLSYQQPTTNNQQPTTHFIFLLLSLIFTAATLNAQIKIEERVEIEPQNTIQPNYPVATMEPCGTNPGTYTYQVVYSCSAFPIEPYQQLFPFQSGSALQFSSSSNYEIEIVEGTNYAYMERIAYADPQGNFYEAEYLGSYISSLPGYLLSGTGE